METLSSEAVCPVAAKEEILGDDRDVFDGQLQLQDDDVANLLVHTAPGLSPTGPHTPTHTHIMPILPGLAALQMLRTLFSRKTHTSLICLPTGPPQSDEKATALPMAVPVVWV